VRCCGCGTHQQLLQPRCTTAVNYCHPSVTFIPAHHATLKSILTPTPPPAPPLPPPPPHHTHTQVVSLTAGICGMTWLLCYFAISWSASLTPVLQVNKGQLAAIASLGATLMMARSPASAVSRHQVQSRKQGKKAAKGVTCAGVLRADKHFEKDAPWRLSRHYKMYVLCASSHADLTARCAVLMSSS
jgi:hypothetical protein